MINPFASSISIHFPISIGCIIDICVLAFAIYLQKDKAEISKNEAV